MAHSIFPVFALMCLSVAEVAAADSTLSGGTKFYAPQRCASGGVQLEIRSVVSENQTVRAEVAANYDCWGKSRCLDAYCKGLGTLRIENGKVTFQIFQKMTEPCFGTFDGEGRNQRITLHECTNIMGRGATSGSLEFRVK